MKEIAHRAFRKVTPEMVGNCIDRVKEQEDWYRYLHKIPSLPVESIESDNYEIPINSEIQEINEECITFNEEGADVNVRMEGDSDQNLFYLDAGNDRIGIGTSSPTHKLHVVGNTSIAMDTCSNARLHTVSTLE